MRDTHLPCTPDEIIAAAAALGLAIPDACMPGVLANLALLDRHAGVLRAHDECEP